MKGYRIFCSIDCENKNQLKLSEKGGYQQNIEELKTLKRSTQEFETNVFEAEKIEAYRSKILELEDLVYSLKQKIKNIILKSRALSCRVNPKRKPIK